MSTLLSRRLDTCLPSHNNESHKRTYPSSSWSCAAVLLDSHFYINPFICMAQGGKLIKPKLFTLHRRPFPMGSPLFSHSHKNHGQCMHSHRARLSHTIKAKKEWNYCQNIFYQVPNDRRTKQPTNF